MNCRPIIGLFGFLVGDVSLVVRFETERERGDALIEVLIHMIHDDMPHTQRAPKSIKTASRIDAPPHEAIAFCLNKSHFF